MRIALLCLLLAGCHDERPDYFIRPSEMREAETLCAAAGFGDLVGLGVTVQHHRNANPTVVYHAQCKAGARRWFK